MIPNATSAALPYLVVLDSGMPEAPDIGRRYALDPAGTLIGSGSDSHIQLPMDFSVSHHVRVYEREGQWYLHNLHRTNDVQVEHTVVGIHPLRRDGETFSIGKALFAFMLGTGPWSRYHEDAERRSDTDALLHIANRRAFEKGFRVAMSTLIRRGGSLALAMLDIDFFKRINTENGHLGADSVLKEFTRLVNTRVREEELFARWGGEEFVVLMPGASHKQCITSSERIRMLIEQHAFVVKGRRVPVTVSIGIASTDREIDLDTFTTQANDRLLLAKEQGRNRVLG